MDLETAIQSEVSQKEMNVLSNTLRLLAVCFLVGVRQGSASCPILAGGYLHHQGLLTFFACGLCQRGYFLTQPARGISRVNLPVVRPSPP